jgi:hypothetical protein
MTSLLLDPGPVLSSLPPAVFCSSHPPFSSDSLIFPVAELRTSPARKFYFEDENVTLGFAVLVG